MGLGALADVPVRLLSTGPAQARDARAGRGVGRAACGCSTSRSTALDATGPSGWTTSIADHRASGGAVARRVARAARRRLARSWSSGDDRRADRPRRAPRRSAARRWLPVAFFLLVATLVPFAVGPDARLLARIGGGALWIAALTAALLPIERLVEPDRADGVLDQLALHGVAEESVAAAKIVAHWLTFAPLLLLAAVPGVGAARDATATALGRALIALAVGTPGLAALAVAVAALTAGLPRAGSLAGLLLLPLAVPLLIFGAAATGDGGRARCCWRRRFRC